MAGAGGTAEAKVRFEDVMVHFSTEEWETLEKWQQDLYCDVLKDNYESLVVIGNPITRSDFIAWFERCEREAKESIKRHSSGAGDPPGSSRAHGEFRQRDSKPCAEAPEPARMGDGRLQGKKAQFGDLEDHPERLQVPVTQQGEPRKDQHGPGVEKATQESPSHTRSQGASLPPKTYKCQECGQRFRLKRLLCLHQRISLQKPSLPCSQCGVCFPRGRRLTMHQRTHHHETAHSGCAGGPSMVRGSPVAAAEQEGPYFCTGCGESFRRYLGFLQHRKSHEEGALWPCAQCSVTLLFQSDLAMHEESHLEEALRSCASCGEGCLCKLSLLLHFAAHLGKSAEDGRRDSQEDTKPPWETEERQEAHYACHQCGLQFRLEGNLEVHHRYCHKEGLQKYRYNPGPSESPETCGKGAGNELVPRASRNSSCPLSQTSSASWVCSHCRKSFISKFLLCRHKAQEHKRAARPDARGLAGRTLVAVMKKLHKCQECGKRFVFKSQLSGHQKAHSKEHRRWQTYCRESFGKPPGVRSERPPQHRGGFCTPALPVKQRRQGEEAPCRCAECGKSFTKSYFPAHQAWHAGWRYRCVLCGNMSNFKSGAYQHILRHRDKGDFSTCPKCGTKDRFKGCLCLIVRIYVGQKPLAPTPREQEGGAQLAKDLGGERPPPRHSNQRRQSGKRRERRRGSPSGQSLPKPFRCAECGKGFAYKARLRTHHKTHTGEWPFQCAECGKSFLQKCYLDQHWKVHVREKV